MTTEPIFTEVELPLEYRKVARILKNLAIDGNLRTREMTWIVGRQIAAILEAESLAKFRQFMYEASIPLNVTNYFEDVLIPPCRHTRSGIHRCLHCGGMISMETLHKADD